MQPLSVSSMKHPCLNTIGLNNRWCLALAIVRAHRLDLFRCYEATFPRTAAQL